MKRVETAGPEGHLASEADPPTLLVIDVEATCDVAGRIPRREMETIEIGAVLVDEETLEAIDEFQTFIKPRRHPKLSDFCTGLTSITQRDVDAAPSFAEAVEQLRIFLRGRRPTFCSWGDYDRDQLSQDAAHAGVTLPFSIDRHVNLKRQFAEHQNVNLKPGEQKKLGTGGALRRVGLEFEGTPHRGIDDARNIARLLPWSLGRKIAPPNAHAPPRKGRR